MHDEALINKQPRKGIVQGEPTMEWEQLTIKGYNVKVDVERTKELYEPLPLVSEEAHCGCVDCCFYVNAIRHSSPAIQHFFQRLGIDPRKEGNIWKAGELDNGTYLYIVDYRLIGEIEGAVQLGWIEIDEAKFSLTNSPVLPSPMLELQVEIMISSNR